ncbi:MAG: fimbrillin family protein [Prevotella sp.]|jgi:hypothetical protein|nr:fimbrillin family protein [Prevotella sp.]
MRVRISLSKGLVPLLFSSLLMILCLAGCAEDSNILDNGQSRQLKFSVSTHSWDYSDKSSDQKIPSRASPISTFDTSKNFNVIADVNKGGSWSTEVNNETVFYSRANKIWQTTATHYWPGSGSNINFYAYYPTSISSSITHVTGSAPVLSYTVPDNAADQIDILASSKTEVTGDSYSQTPVDFKHILAAVQFRVGSSGMINGTLTKISINGIQNIGSYSFINGWTPQTSSTTTYTKNVSAASNAGTEIVSGNDPFFVMPQTLSNASFTVTYSGGATLTKSLSGTWEAGKVYDYNINSFFSATQDFSYTGNVQTYTVPFTGTYKLEVWGAQGGNEPYGKGGKGGESVGYIHLSNQENLYVCVGGQGKQNTSDKLIDIPAGGYNGGGGLYTYEYGSTGGGATHIAITNRGTLEKYKSYQNEIIIVAGGGGGASYWPNAYNTTDGITMPANTYYDGGYGGGVTGGSSGGSSSNQKGILSYSGGTQTEPGNGFVLSNGLGGFGYGGKAHGGGCCGGGGGSGWYGGMGGYDNSAGSGGSGYINSTYIINGSMQNGVRSGNGYARITFVSAN